MNRRVPCPAVDNDIVTDSLVRVGQKACIATIVVEEPAIYSSLIGCLKVLERLLGCVIVVMLRLVNP